MRSTRYYFLLIAEKMYRPSIADPDVILRTWLLDNPRATRLKVAALSIVERGQASDLDWWQVLKTQDEQDKLTWERWTIICLIKSGKLSLWGKLRQRQLYQETLVEPVAALLAAIVAWLQRPMRIGNEVTARQWSVLWVVRPVKLIL